MADKITYTAGTSSTSNTFRNYSGLFTFSINLPEGAIIDSVTFNFRENALKRNTNTDGKYSIHYAPPGTSAGNGYSITDQQQILILSSSTSQYVSSNIKWTVNDSDLEIFSDNSSFSVYVYRDKYTSYDGSLYYQTVGGYKGALDCTITYRTASVTDPTNLTITQNLEGTYTLSWDASTGSNGSGQVTYSIKDSDGITIAQNLSVTRYTASIPSQYNYTYTWRVTAHYSGTNSNSIRIDAKFQPPSINRPTQIYISPSSGESVDVSWTPATLEYTNGTIRYVVYYKLNQNNTYHHAKTVYTNSISFNETDLKAWGTDGDSFIFQVDAYASDISNNADGNYSQIGPAASPDSSTFTFITGNVIAYGNSNGQWEECKVYYCAYESSGYVWKECVPYYCAYDSSSGGYTWKEINSKVN